MDLLANRQIMLRFSSTGSWYETATYHKNNLYVILIITGVTCALQFFNKQAEKAKHEEKEMKKLQDSLKSAQLRLAARELTCRSLQEKVQLIPNLEIF